MQLKLPWAGLVCLVPGAQKNIHLDVAFAIDSSQDVAGFPHVYEDEKRFTKDGAAKIRKNYPKSQTGAAVYTQTTNLIAEFDNPKMFDKKVRRLHAYSPRTRVVSF